MTKVAQEPDGRDLQRNLFGRLTRQVPRQLTLPGKTPIAEEVVADSIYTLPEILSALALVSFDRPSNDIRLRRIVHAGAAVSVCPSWLALRQLEMVVTVPDIGFKPLQTAADLPAIGNPRALISTEAPEPAAEPPAFSILLAEDGSRHPQSRVIIEEICTRRRAFPNRPKNYRAPLTPSAIAVPLISRKVRAISFELSLIVENSRRL